MLHPATLSEALSVHPRGRLVPVVADANVLIRDVCATLRRDAPSALFSQAESKMIRLLTTPRVAHEVETRIHRVARERTDEAVALWRDSYAPLIRVVDLGEPADPHIAGVLARVEANDPDDVPTAHLALLVAPCIVLTTDSDLLDEGFGAPEWLTGLRTSGELQSLDGGVWISTAGTAILFTEMVRGVAAASRAAARSPAALAAVLAALFVAVTDGRPALVRAGARVRTSSGPAFDALVRLGDELSQRRRLLIESLSPYELPQLQPAPPVAHVARVLATAPAPIPLSRLADHTAIDRADLQRLLRSGPAFESVPGHGWQLGGALSRGPQGT